MRTLAIPPSCWHQDRRLCAPASRQVSLCRLSHDAIPNYGRGELNLYVCKPFSAVFRVPRQPFPAVFFPRLISSCHPGVQSNPAREKINPHSYKAIRDNAGAGMGSPRCVATCDSGVNTKRMQKQAEGARFTRPGTVILTVTMFCGRHITHVTRNNPDNQARTHENKGYCRKAITPK